MWEKLVIPVLILIKQKLLKNLMKSSEKQEKQLLDKVLTTLEFENL